VLKIHKVPCWFFIWERRFKSFLSIHGAIHAFLFKKLLLGANGITQVAFTYFWGNIFRILFKKSLKIQNYLIFFILICQGLCKRFQNMFNFQKFWSLFISPFNAKKHTLQCLMSDFESLLFIKYFSN
jgi:hypothetical protein